MSKISHDKQDADKPKLQQHIDFFSKQKITFRSVSTRKLHWQVSSESPLTLAACLRKLCWHDVHNGPSSHSQVNSRFPFQTFLPLLLGVGT